jgi:hypothetical protein
MKRTLAVLLCCSMLTGCASIFGANADPITIHSKYPDATISVNGNEVGSGQATYKVKRGSSVTIMASRKGCQDRTTISEQAFAGIAALNLVCIFCWIVDAATGKMHRTYPTDYTINPACPEAL